MMYFVFVRIPSFLFEPIAFFGFLGGITALLHRHKRNYYWEGIIAISIGIMLFWRLAAYSIMTSTRYVSILLYPAIIFATWFCFQLRDFFKCIIVRIARKRRDSFEKKRLIIPLILITGLVIASCIKTLKYDPYGNFTVKTCKSLAKQIEKGDYLLYAYTTQGEQERIAYYTGIDLKEVKELNVDSRFSFKELLKQKIDYSKDFFKNVFFVFFLNKEDPEPDKKYLNIGPEIGKWKCIHRESTSRRKTKELVLYQFVPAQTNIEIWEKAIPSLSPDNMCINGDFEEALSNKDLEQRIAYYKEIGTSDYYLSSKRLFPTQWWFGIGKPNDGKSPEVSLTENKPIAGKFSFELNSNNSYDWGTNSNSIPKQDCIFSGFIYTKSEAIVRVRPCYWDVDKKQTCYINTYTFHLRQGKTYRFSFPVNESDVPEKDGIIYIVVQGSGHILLDNVEFIKNKTTMLRDGPSENRYSDNGC